jgi:hypothetical protein
MDLGESGIDKSNIVLVGEVCGLTAAKGMSKATGQPRIYVPKACYYGSTKAYVRIPAPRITVTVSRLLILFGLLGSSSSSTSLRVLFESSFFSGASVVESLGFFPEDPAIGIMFGTAIHGRKEGTHRILGSVEVLARHGEVNGVGHLYVISPLSGIYTDPSPRNSILIHIFVLFLLKFQAIIRRTTWWSMPSIQQFRARAGAWQRHFLIPMPVYMDMLVLLSSLQPVRMRF